MTTNPEFDPESSADHNEDSELPGFLTDPSLEDDAAEFSLEDLSRAYAQILQPTASVTSSPDDNHDRVTGTPSGATRSEEPEPAEIDELSEATDNAGIAISEHGIVEALLFVGVPPDETLTAKKIAGVMRDVSPKEIKQIIADLNRKYESEQAPYRIQSVGTGYQLLLQDEFLPVREAFYGEIREAELNQAAIEVLAIVAYQQPLGRAEIDQIRQRPSGAILSQLTERQLLALAPDTHGRQKQYITTPRFLELFGLESLEDLPLAQEVEDIDEFFDGGN